MDKKGLIVSIVALGIVAYFGYSVLDLKRQSDKYISVNGLSERHLDSDLAVWNIGIIAEADSIKDAMSKVEEHEKIVVKFLKDAGFKEDEMSVRDSIYITDRDKRTYDSKEVENLKARFGITDTIKIETKDLKKLKQAYPNLARLMEQDVRITESINYTYTNFANLRIDMLKEATKDAENRAKQIAESIGSKVGNIKHLATGTFTVTADDAAIDREYSYGSEKSLKKRFRVVVHASFDLKS